MKLINYKYGYLFDCSIHGKITMTAQEFAKVQKYLFNPAVMHKIAKFQGSYHTGAREMMKRDIHNALKLKEPARSWINIRVPATQALVERFKPEGAKYKRANYMLEILHTNLPAKNRTC